jgi:hypothetical protein
MAKLTQIGLAFAAASLMLLATGATADTVTFPPLEESIPPPSVTYWIKYKVLGPRNAPAPVILISTRRYKPLGLLETLIVLPRRRYDIVARFTESQSADCMHPLPPEFPWYTLGIFERDLLTPKCVMPQAFACKYLADVSKLSGVRWTAAELKPINDLAISIKCRSRTYINGKPYP